MPTSSGHVAVATRTSTWAGASSSAMRRIRPRSCGVTVWCTSTVARCASRPRNSIDGGVLGGRRDLLAEEREQLDGLVVAENQRVADDRVAALVQARQQRIVLFGEIDAEQRRQQAAQPEVLEQHDLAAAHAAAGGDVERQRQPAPRAMPARQRWCGAQPLAPPVSRQRRVRRPRRSTRRATRDSLRARRPERSAGARARCDPRAASARPRSSRGSARGSPRGVARGR